MVKGVFFSVVVLALLLSACSSGEQQVKSESQSAKKSVSSSALEKASKEKESDEMEEESEKEGDDLNEKSEVEEVEHEAEDNLEENVPSSGTSEVATGSSQTQVESQTEKASDSQSSGITLAEVAAHNNAQSCWTAINGKVYDLTDWISKHPGGAGNILRLCGIDGTSAFLAKHGGQGKPNSVLAGYEIGVLSE